VGVCGNDEHVRLPTGVKSLYNNNHQSSGMVSTKFQGHKVTEYQESGGVDEEVQRSCGHAA